MNESEYISIMAGTNSQKQPKKGKKKEGERNEGTENLQCRRFPFWAGQRLGRGRVEDATLYKAVWGRAITLRCVEFVLCFGFVVAIKYIITVS